MKNQNNACERGSEWRQWDLHIHTPASFHWHGQKFTGDWNHDSRLVDEMIEALNKAEPAVFALMDYWTFEGWFSLKRRLKESGAPALQKTVFPGIELRLVAPTACRLNAHVIFSDKIADQDLHDFQAALQVAIVGKPLSQAALKELARSIGADKLTKHGFDKNQVDSNDTTALVAGSTIAEIGCESYKAAIAKVPKGHAIGFMPYDTNDGLSEVNWQDHYAYFLGLFKSSPIFESRNNDLRSAFINEETPGNKEWLKSFQIGLNNVPRLVVSGSDAHRFVGIKNDNDKRGYGDFPSRKVTWIKADPTFPGLLQAIMEPAKRSHIGEWPKKMVEVANNKTFFIDSLEVCKNPGATCTGAWLDGTRIKLSSDLIAIIGNKGSGKSAMADIIGLLGNSRQEGHFTFLKKGRFKGKSGDPAKQFTGKLIWLDGSIQERNLNEDVPSDKAELVRYIPQGHFEELCDSHVYGKSNAFEQELRSVIFSHADGSTRLGALDFDQLIEMQENRFRDQLNELRKRLSKLNQAIATAENQLQPEMKKKLQDLLVLKSRQIEEHKKLKPAECPKPTGQLTPDQQAAADEIAKISNTIKLLDEQWAKNVVAEALIAGKLKAIQNIRERVKMLERASTQFEEDSSKDFEVLEIKPGELVTLTVNTKPLDEIAASLPVQRQALAEQNDKSTTEKVKLKARLEELNSKLNEPQLLYQAYLKAHAEWQNKLAELTGTAEAPETQKGLEARIAQLDLLPELLTMRKEERVQITSEIFDTLNAQRKSREDLFKPVQNLIQVNNLIREDYKLQFQATLGGASDTVADSLFTLIKQNTGEFRGDDESFATVKRIADEHGFSTKEGVLGFVNALHEAVSGAAAGGNQKAVGIANILRKDKNANEVYDLLFGISFLEPRYTLLFQDTQIEQLSPGQRGALLLIFYLLVDKGHNPIILDQPEENLDNETVVSLLVPVLTEAKKKRQIIMVTHNPNLAVVCDAEQVIYSKFDRKGGQRITYVAGAIESSIINRHVVNVLEGTKPAFDNRRIKYHG